MRAPAFIGLALVFVSLSALSGQGRESRHVVVVTGIGGEPVYGELFHRWAVSFLDVVHGQLRIDPRNVAYLAEDRALSPERVTGPSRKEEIARALADVADRSAPGDLVMLLLIGHGTARDDRVLFNLPGPDLSAAELSAMLDRLEGRRVVVVNAASASGPFIPLVSGPGRVVITATASAAENRHPRFGGHFVTAFAQPAADGDKDGQVSLLEAFAYVDKEVALGYERDRQLRTEHALLDDDGDGVGTRTPGGSHGDGRRAARTTLVPVDAAAASGPGALAIAAAGQALVDRIEALRGRKRQMSADEYLAQLETLLVELALNRRAMRGGGLP